MRASPVRRGYLGGAFAVSKDRWAARIAELFELIGTDLLRISTAVERRGGRVRASVVGHSIGGALASVTALALAEAFPAWDIAVCTFAAAPFAEAAPLRESLARPGSIAAWVSLANGDEYFRDPRVFKGRDFSGGLENWFSVMEGDGAAAGREAAEAAGGLRVLRARGSELGGEGGGGPLRGIPLRGAMLLIESTPDLITRRVRGGASPAPAAAAVAAEAPSELLHVASIKPAAAAAAEDDAGSSSSGSLVEAAADDGAGGSSGSSALGADDGEGWSLVKSPPSGKSASSSSSVPAPSVLGEAAAAVLPVSNAPGIIDGIPSELVENLLGAPAASAVVHQQGGRTTGVSGGASSGTPAKGAFGGGTPLAALLKELAPSSHRAFQVAPNTYVLI